ncbi:glycosyltransferase family 25 protein [Agrobacterium rosae]|uniref:glycosyltransferase family 25 protein n=1 Tax=Agrobacterium rosae TaxID=1972867 RepID=UPI002A0CFCB5|nr:glycosyltransferase family 25 protein [Agrobacterium rosae]MDX8315813.1 glycosyltransferase family 25 protein [Agrobacterium rosae]
MHLLPSSRRRLDVYLINLAGAEKRRDAMLSKISALGLPVQRIEATDGRKLTFPIPEFCELSYKLLHGRRTSPPEVGCYLSHVECARTFLQGDSDFALILEDDVSFEEDFVKTIDDAISHATDWDILRLSTVSNGRKFPFKRISDGRSLAITMTREKGSGAYIINRRAADWITSRLVPMRLAYDIAYDLEYLAGLKSAFVYPLCATQDADSESQIQRGLRALRLPKWRYVSVLPYRTYLEVSRFLFRGSRLAYCKIVNSVTSQMKPRALRVGGAEANGATLQAEPYVSPGVNPIK